MLRVLSTASSQRNNHSGLTTLDVYSDSVYPFKPYGIFHRYQLEQSTSVLREAGGVFFIFIKILIDQSASKQWRP